MDRFRLVVRHFLSHQYSVIKLGPAFLNCNDRQTACTRRSASPRQGCTNCEYTIKTKEFRVLLEKELSVLKKGTRQGAAKWPLNYLLNLAVEIGSIAGQKTKSKFYNTELLASIYRDEEGKLKATQNWVPPSVPQGK